MACSRCDHADFLALLLKGGADPSLRHPLTGLTPAAEAAGIGAVDEAAELIERAAVPRGPWTLEQLGWAEAVAQAVGGGRQGGPRCAQPLFVAAEFGDFHAGLCQSWQPAY
jgi:hypothetical protein